MDTVQRQEDGRYKFTADVMVGGFAGNTATGEKQDFVATFDAQFGPIEKA